MNCLSDNCRNEVTRDYPMCKQHEPFRHFTNRPCRCESCANPDIFPAAVRARFPNLVLIAKSDDPPELRRVEITIENLEPECRPGFARALANLLNSVAKAA